MAHGVPAARHCVPPHPDRHAVRHGAAAAGVTFLHPLARATASDHLWLVLADGVARAGTREALLATVDSVGVSARRLDLTAAVGAATRLVDAEPLPAREVHVVSDLQRTALGSGRAAVP